MPDNRPDPARALGTCCDKLECPSCVLIPSYSRSSWLPQPTPRCLPTSPLNSRKWAGWSIPPGAAKLYRPLQPTPPYPGVKVERDIKYFDDDRTVLDVFSPEKGGGNRPVLIYVSGGAGNKIEPVPDGDAFYDNIMLWAVKNGMTGVNVQRRGGQGLEWDETAKDIGRVIEWVQQNISKYKGNPDRVFIWAHSAGTGPVSTYVGHPELYGPKGVGLKGVDAAWALRVSTSRRSLCLDAADPAVPRKAVLRRRQGRASRRKRRQGQGIRTRSAARSSHAARAIESARAAQGQYSDSSWVPASSISPGVAEFHQHPQGPALHGEDIVRP